MKWVKTSWPYNLGFIILYLLYLLSIFVRYVQNPYLREDKERKRYSQNKTEHLCHMSQLSINIKKCPLSTP